MQSQASLISVVLLHVVYTCKLQSSIFQFSDAMFAWDLVYKIIIPLEIIQQVYKVWVQYTKN